MVKQVYSLTREEAQVEWFKKLKAEEAQVEWFYEDLQDLLELTPQKKMPFSS